MRGAAPILVPATVLRTMATFMALLWLIAAVAALTRRPDGGLSMARPGKCTIEACRGRPGRTDAGIGRMPPAALRLGAPVGRVVPGRAG
ncbi:hypothetical protein FRACA_1840007 [Frankia canadensis]|uniref:Uncharacterized protein n=1 Tax=Frankia canadensis TaxID=1836972 RepID=A0A2I2KNV5_9ACTN|nr:hypothetical protein FRACA_1840007 [Frankia canadensis]SOU54641.1 hypothetical protein FRACA_1840007 [Frankia canadensis]